MDLNQVSISIGKYYQDSVTCDVVIWTSVISFSEDSGNITSMLPMRPIPQTTRSTKKRVPSLVSQRNQSDRNSIESSFEEGGTDVGDRRVRQDKQQAKIT